MGAQLARGGTSVNEVLVSGCARKATSFLVRRRKRIERHEGLGHSKASAAGPGAGECSADRVGGAGRWRGPRSGRALLAGSGATARHPQAQPTWRPLRVPRGEAGAMVPIRWGISGAGEVGSPFQGKGQIARLGSSSHGT